MGDRDMPMGKKYLVLDSLIYHREGDEIHDYFVFRTHGPKATLLEVFQTLTQDIDSLPAATDKGEILRLLTENGTLVRGNGRRIFALVHVEGKKDVILDAHIGYYGEGIGYSKISYREYDPFKFDMKWYLDSGHYVLVRA